MSDRTIRRAAERKAAKLAAKANKASDPETPNVDFEASSEDRPVSQKRIDANRQNAQHSTGAKTQAGREKSKMNALRNALTGQTVLLPTDDAVAYQAFIDSLYAQWSPDDDQEKRLTQLIADTEWRIHRVAALEINIFAVGRLEQPEGLYSESEGLLYAKLHLIYEKQLKNLALQERRLRNQHKSDTFKLEQLQQDRIEKAKQTEQALIDERKAYFERAIRIARKCTHLKKAFHPADFGFEFSLAEYDHYWDLQDPYFEITGEYLDFHKVIEAFRNAKKVA